jgi:glutaryl-CoA dehydrogenase
VADGYRLTGSGDVDFQRAIADVFVVWAKSAAHDNQIRGFILEKGMKACRRRRSAASSLRASITGEIVMDGVVVPEDALLPNACRPEGAFGCLNRAAQHFLGRAGRCRGLHAPCPPVHARPQAVRPTLAATELVQKKLADMETEIALGLQASLRVGRPDGRGVSSPRDDLDRQAQQLRQSARHRACPDMHGGNGVRSSTM